MSKSQLNTILYARAEQQTLDNFGPVVVLLREDPDLLFVTPSTVLGE